MTAPHFLPPRDNDEDAAIAAQIEAAIGFALPTPTQTGVSANVRLLEQHWATLREAPGR